MSAATLALFSYGTLQHSDVQLATFGRLLDGEPDELAGFRVEPLRIGSPAVVALSGMEIHTIARRTGNAKDVIPGVVFAVTAAELEAADAYETDAYARVEVELASGRRAFVYVGADA
ncbi:MAG TPA: gamma-glutamylcyclotransferase family protein [Allosphingosinicella sp.]|jgi:hypothetical protein